MNKASSNTFVLLLSCILLDKECHIFLFVNYLIGAQGLSRMANNEGNGNAEPAIDNHISQQDGETQLDVYEGVLHAIQRWSFFLNFQPVEFSNSSSFFSCESRRTQEGN